MLPVPPALPTVAASSARETPEQRFRRVWQAHGAAVTRAASSYARGAAELADLRQEIALALWRALPAFRGECSERSFVYRIAHNRGMTHAARRGPAPLADPLPEPIDADAVGADARLEDGERRRRLRAAITALPLALRQALTLALEDLTHDEIAEVLGITANNVAVRLSRARDALRRILEADT